MENEKTAKIQQLRLRYLGEKVANSENGKIVKGKSFSFAVRIVKLRQHLNQKKKEYSMSGQL